MNVSDEWPYTVDISPLQSPLESASVMINLYPETNVNSL